MKLARMLVMTLGLLAAVAQVAQAAGSVTADAITQSMHKAFPQLKIGDIQSTPVPGIVSVEVNGTDRAYLTQDGKYMFVGSLYQLDSPKGVVNLTAEHLASVRKKAFTKLDKSHLTTFKADGKQKAQVYVFTDVTCPFCKRFHDGMAAINKLGITVHYLAFPRMGLGNRVSKEMGKVWCARDPQKALTAAMKGKSVVNVPERSGCLSPVANQYNLGAKLGVRGTPAVYSADGHELGGYLSPAHLAAKLGLKNAG